MNPNTRSIQPARSLAFTLIELLVVIAVIALLAAMIFPITGAVNKAKILKRTQAERAQLETAIQSYHLKLGHYPPDNPSNSVVHQLYYELAGTTLNQGIYSTLDGSAKIQDSKVKAEFFRDGLVNCTRGAGGDEGGAAQAFLKGIKPGQVQELTSGAKVFVGVPFQKTGTVPFDQDPVILNPTVNPWRYNSSHPTNNATYDLWLDVIIAGKAYRICNWSKEPLKVTQ